MDDDHNLSAETLRKVNAKMAVRHRDVVDYWSAREDECGLGVDWADAGNRCHREAPNVSDPRYMWMWIEHGVRR